MMTSSELGEEDLIYRLKCGHEVLVDGMDGMMNMQGSELKVYRCPMMECRAVLTDEPRYQKQLKTMKLEIQKVKQEIVRRKKEEEIARRKAEEIAASKEAMKVMQGTEGGYNWLAGHWNKCPNGHLYFIGECGQAMQKGVCPDCGAKIGGSDHKLTEGNTNTNIDALNNEFSQMNL